MTSVLRRIPLVSSPILAITLVAMTWGSAAIAQDRRSSDSEIVTLPGAPQVLPADAMAYLRLDDVDDIRQSWADTSFGRMLADPGVRPLAGETYSLISEAIEKAGEQIGISLDELISIPSGQFAIAVIPRRVGEDDPSTNETGGKGEEVSSDDDESEEAIRRRIAQRRRRNNSFSFVIIIDAKQQADRLIELLRYQEKRLTENNRFVVRRRKIDDIELTQIVPSREGRQPLEYFRGGGTVVIGVGERTASAVLDQWQGRSDEPILAEHPRFVRLMSRCIGEEETRPQATIYVDPAAIVERLMRRRMETSLVIPMVQTLGLQRLKGIGASSFRGGDYFEDITHIHIAIDPPRDGILSLLRPGEGPSMPPPWVPADIASYTTLQWRFDVLLKNAESFVGTFTGGKTIDEAFVEPVRKWSGISIRDDLLPIMTGRYVLVRRLGEVTNQPNMVSIHGIEVSDPAKAKLLIERVRGKRPKFIRADTISGRTVYRLGPELPPKVRENFQPTMFLVDDYVMVTTNDEAASHIIATSSDLRERLGQNVEFERLAAELSGMIGSEPPFQITFVRGEEFLRFGYQWAMKAATESGEISNPLFAGLRDMLLRNELPPFDELAKYFSPGGGYMYDEPGGIHYTTFTLRSPEFNRTDGAASSNRR